MKKFFTRTLTVCCLLAASFTASAQYKAEFEQYPRSGYDTDAVEFKLTEIATALETDTTTLRAALDNMTGEMFTLEGDESAAFNCTPNGYWLNKEAVKTDWGDNAFWYVNASWNSKEDIFAIEVGQYPGHFVGGEQTSVAHLGLVFNGKKVTFDVSLKVLAINLPDPTTVLSKLNIVGRGTTEVHQWARANEKADADTVDIKGAAEALGIDPSLLSVGLSKVLYATTIVGDETSDQFGYKSDSLTNASTAEAPGWWFANPFDGYDEFVSVASTNGLFFAENFSYDAETEQLALYVGQMGGAFPIEIEGFDPITSAQSKVYLVYGDKAYELTIKLVIDEREKTPFAEMTEVGSDSIIITQVPTTNYESTSFSLDIDAIAALLGAEVADISPWAPDGAGDITDEVSANNDGFWFTKEGTWAKYGSGCGLYVENPTAGDYTTFNVGQYPNAFSDGDTGVATLYFVFLDKYYTVNIKVNIKEPEGPGVEFESVATRAMNIQIVPSGAYDVEMKFNIDPADLELIETTDPVLYAQKAPAEGTTSTGDYSKAYSCTPYPGFWMSAEGFAATWGSSPWGFTYDNPSLTCTFYQMPNQNKVGDEYKAVCYLVNETNGKMITYNMDIKFVQTIVPQAEVVGQESIMLPVKAGDWTSTDIDFSACLEALGLTEVSEVLSLNSLSVLMEDGTMSEPMAPSTGASISDAGYLDLSETLENTHINVEFDATDTKTLQFAIEEYLSDWADDMRITSKIGFQKETSIYIFNVSFVSEAVYTGITSTKATKSNTLFDLSGRRVSKAQRGIYIRNGRKVVK